MNPTPQDLEKIESKVAEDHWKFVLREIVKQCPFNGKTIETIIGLVERTKKKWETEERKRVIRELREAIAKVPACDQLLGTQFDLLDAFDAKAKEMGLDPSEISLCLSCHCMTHTSPDGACGKCLTPKHGVFSSGT